MVGNSSLISLACPFSGGSGPHQGSLSDDRSRCSQVGQTHPRLRWVWQRPEGESRLWLILSLISSQLPGAPREAVERLLIAEPAAREMRGQMWPRSQSFTAVNWKWCRCGAIRRQRGSQGHHSLLSLFASKRPTLSPAAPLVLGHCLSSEGYLSLLLAHCGQQLYCGGPREMEDLFLPQPQPALPGP